MHWFIATKNVFPILILAVTLDDVDKALNPERNGAMDAFDPEKNGLADSARDSFSDKKWNPHKNGFLDINTWKKVEKAFKEGILIII